MIDRGNARLLSRRDSFKLGLGSLIASPWLTTSAGLGSNPSIPAAPKPVAAVVTVYRKNSHADVILTKILEGWKHDGGPGPSLKLAAIYIDQPEPSTFGIELCRKHGVPIFKSIEEAITLGSNSIPVDGVLSIGEHGDYPVNSLGQQLYPRKRFFEEITKCFEKAGRVVPVFNDKHISTVWEEAQWIYDQARVMKIPFMSGSSLPVTFRTQPLDIPLGTRLDAAVGTGYSGLDIYGFHALECYQTIVERRANAETGVQWVRCLEGAEVWQALDSDWVDDAMLESVYDAIPKSKASIREDDNPVLFQFQYCDGFHGTLLMLANASLTGISIRLADQQIMATGFEERPEPRYPHFAYLLKGIEQMIHTGKPAYPVERTLLTTGILDRALHSRSLGGKKLETPELHIAYQPIDYPHAPNIELTTDYAAVH